MRNALLLLLPAVSIVTVSGVASADEALVAGQGFDSVRVIAKANGVCRATPDPASEVTGYYRIGAVLKVPARSTIKSGKVWYSDEGRINLSRPSCWVDAAQTVGVFSGRPEMQLAAVADALLAGKGTTFVDEVELAARLEERRDIIGGNGPAIDVYPILRGKWLMLINDALHRIGRLDRDPLRHAWLVAHQDLMYYHDPSASWHMLSAPFLEVIDANRNEPWTEQLAWAVANLPPGGDECDADCYLGMLISREGEYLRRFPTGPHAPEAMTRAEVMVKDAITAVGEGPPTQPAIDLVRTCVAGVPPAVKASLLDRLAELQKHVKPPRTE